MRTKKNKEKLLIIGSGVASKLLLKDMRYGPATKYSLIGFLDDFKKRGAKFSGKTILGKIKDLSEITQKKRVDTVILAIPSIEKKKLDKIVRDCEKEGINLKILAPSYIRPYSLKTGRPWIEELRPINIEDLLRRDTLKANLQELKEIISNKIVIVTGGGGSIGSELCRQIVELSPRELIILDNSEFNLYRINEALGEKHGSKSKITPIIGDIRDRRFIEEIFRKKNINLVFHAAAYKHVPLMESNIGELVKNNIFGTYNLAHASEKYGVGKFVLVSTDKVINPTSAMGVSKKIAEEVLGLFGKKTKFMVVRFGNVLGSRGSVIPLFKEQIRKGGPITITHPKMKRFFMTIPEASRLILQAASIGDNKDVLVLDMGKQYLVKEVAERLVALYGLNPKKDIKFEYIGIRPGEKLYEELWTKDERLSKTTNDRISVCKLEDNNPKKIRLYLETLSSLAIKGDAKGIRSAFKEIIPTYTQIFNKKGLSELKIFITGGDGFVASKLKERFDLEGIKYDSFSRKDGNLSEQKTYESLPKYDMIFHLASKLPQKGENNFQEDEEVMKNILNYCKKNNSKLIYTSSAAVYGNKEGPIEETSIPSPVNEYGKSKKNCEKLFKKSGVKGFIFRVFNLYGQNQYKKFVIPHILESLKEGRVVLTRGVKRDFIEVGDLVRAIMKAGEYPSGGLETINLGSGEEKSLLEVLEIMRGITGESPKVILRESPEGEIRNSYAEISKAKKILNWEPEISIEEGIRDLIT